ncbi:Unknown protein, partial [Striga hermonthica]
LSQDTTVDHNHRKGTSSVADTVTLYSMAWETTLPKIKSTWILRPLRGIFFIINLLQFSQLLITKTWVVLLLSGLFFLALYKIKLSSVIVTR